MDSPPYPIVESLALGLLTIEMEGPDTFEEALGVHDCPVEAPPYLPTLTHLCCTLHTFSFDTPWVMGKANFFEIFLSDPSTADTDPSVYTQWCRKCNAAVLLELAAVGRPWEAATTQQRETATADPTHQLLVNLHNSRIYTEIDTP